MNKHVLNYHTRLHDWYRQHSILQDQQQHHSDYENVQSEVNGIRNLTKDKLCFINDWCSEVNKTFFVVKKKEFNRTLRAGGHGNPASHRGLHKSMNPQLTRSSDDIILSHKWDKQSKTFAKDDVILQSGNIEKCHSVCCGENNGTAKLLNKHTRQIDNFRHLDLSIRHSNAGILENRGLSRVNHDSFNLRENTLIFKRNGSRSSVNSLGYYIWIRNNSLHRKYRLTSAIRSIKSEGRGYVNLRSGIHRKQSQSDEKLKDTNLDLQKTEEYLIKDKTRASSQKYSKASHNVTENCDTENTINNSEQATNATHEVRPTMSTLYSACGSMCSAHSEYLPTSIVCGNCIHHTDIEIRQTVHTNTRVGASNERMQENISKSHPSKERRRREKIDLTENELPQFKFMARKYMEDYNTHNYNRKHGKVHSDQHFHNNNNNFVNADSYYDTKRSLQDKNNEKKAKDKDEEKTQNNKDVIQAVNVLKTNNGKTRNNRQHESTDTNPNVCPLPSCSQREQSETPTISNICLSNSLLNVLSIDDCKMSMRYTLHKVNVRVDQEGKDNAGIPTEVISPRTFSSDARETTTNKVNMETSKTAKRVSSVLPRAACGGLSTNKMGKMFFDNGDMLFQKNGRSSANLEKAFRAVIYHRPIMHPVGQVRSKNKKSGLTFTREHEGPGYRRLNAVLRKHMDEVLHSRCRQLLSRYKKLATDSV